MPDESEDAEPDVEEGAGPDAGGRSTGDGGSDGADPEDGGVEFDPDLFDDDTAEADDGGLHEFPEPPDDDASAASNGGGVADADTDTRDDPARVDGGSGTGAAGPGPADSGGSADSEPDGESAGAEPDPGADADTETDAEPDADPEPDRDPDADADPDTDGGSGTDDAGSGTDDGGSGGLEKVDRDDPGPVADEGRGDGEVPDSNVTFDDEEVPDPVPEPDVKTADVAELAEGETAGPAPAEPEGPEPEPGPTPDPADDAAPADPDPAPPADPDPAPPADVGTGETVTGEGPTAPTEPTYDGEPEGPPDDEEMPLADHIEEMVTRLGVVAIAVAVATAVAFPLAEDLLVTMWYDIIPATATAANPNASDPHIYGPLEKILAEIKVASLAGILVALPVLVYQSYLFMRPGLYPKERRYYLAAVPTSLVLGTIGMAFAYFLVLPLLFEYFVFYSAKGVDKLAFGLRVTFDLIVAMLGAFAIVFQIPLLIMLAIMMGITSRKWLEDRRLYFWGGFLGLGFLMGGADLTGMAPIIIAATMIALFEGTLLLLRWAKGR